MRSRKIGITNGLLNSSRTKRFAALGWTVVSKFHVARGEVAYKAEQNVLKWIRVELQLPQHLTKKDMNGIGGETETFSSEGPSNAEIVERMTAAIRSQT